MSTATTLPTRTRAIRLAARPHGLPTAAAFALDEVELPPLADGDVLVRNTFLSVDPYMRGRMDEGESYVAPYAVGEVMDGAAVGVVVASRAEGLEPGTTVSHWLSWREHAAGPAAAFTPVDVDGVSPSAYLGILGPPGLTAWIGVREAAAVRPGDTVFVSGAAGAVGSAAGQIAKLLGAGRVIGSAGSAAKVAYLRDELGFDAAFDYHDGPVAEQLAAAAPEGVDVYVDNVGGDHLEAAIGQMTVGGRIALIGMIAGHNDTAPAPGPSNLFELVARRVTARGLLVTDHLDRMPELQAEVGGWLRAGRLHAPETVVDGLERMPDALLGLYRGDNLGKMVVRLDG